MASNGSEARTGGAPSGLPGPRDELFDQLSHPARRRILFELAVADAGDAFDAEEFATEAAPAGRTRVDLRHNHLPKLAAAGYIDWNRQTDTFACGPRFDAVAPALELLVAHSDRLPDE